MPVALIPIYAGREVGEGVSKSNRAEAEAVARVAQGLQGAGVRAADIGIISPYAAQVPCPLSKKLPDVVTRTHIFDHPHLKWAAHSSDVGPPAPELDSAFLRS